MVTPTMAATTGSTTVSVGSEAVSDPAWNARWLITKPSPPSTTSAYGSQYVSALNPWWPINTTVDLVRAAVRPKIAPVVNAKSTARREPKERVRDHEAQAERGHRDRGTGEPRRRRRPVLPSVGAREQEEHGESHGQRAGPAEVGPPQPSVPTTTRRPATRRGSRWSARAGRPGARPLRGPRPGSSSRCRRPRARPATPASGRGAAPVVPRRRPAPRRRLRPRAVAAPMPRHRRGPLPVPTTPPTSVGDGSLFLRAPEHPHRLRIHGCRPRRRGQGASPSARGGGTPGRGRRLPRRGRLPHRSAAALVLPGAVAYGAVELRAELQVGTVAPGAGRDGRHLAHGPQTPAR